MATSYLVALVAGVLFGFSLSKGGLTHYSNIVGVFRFTNLTVIKFMLTALLVGAAGLYAFSGLGWVRLPAVPGTYIVGNVLGGLVFGVGMALTGY
jgi:uncharacterized protein